MTPDLAHPATTEVEDLDTIVLELLARPLAADRDERDSVLIVGDNIVYLGTDRAAREFELAAQPLKHLRHALVVAAQRALSGDVIADICGEEVALSTAEVLRMARCLVLDVAHSMGSRALTSGRRASSGLPEQSVTGEMTGPWHGNPVHAVR